MKRLFKYMAPLLVVLMLGGTGWAYSWTDHVKQAPNNKGDVLIFPWYLALDNGWQTKLTVVNTSETQYTVAKLVIRSFKYSEELLDFFLYLSPADVWTGVIRYDAETQNIVIYSTDDSALISTNPVTFASPEEPINQPMFPVECPGDADFLGYVEVILAAVGEYYYKDINDVLLTCPSGTRTDITAAAPGMAKMTIYNEYGLLSKTVCQNMYFPYDQLGKNPNILAGWMDFQNPSLGLTSSLRTTTLRDYRNRELIAINKETILATDSRNTMTEIEAALSKDNIALPYLNSESDITLHFFTFPTKLTDFSECSPVKESDDPVFGTDSEFFKDNSSVDRVTKELCITYKYRGFDLKENSPKSGSPFSGGDTTTKKFCDEVNFLGGNFPYEEGWVNYTFGTTTIGLGKGPNMGLEFTGAPVLATYLNLGTTGLSLEYGAWTDGVVSTTIRGTKYTAEYYQYADFDVVN